MHNFKFNSNELLAMLHSVYHDKSFSIVVGIIVTLICAMSPIMAPYAFLGGIIAGFLRGMLDISTVWGNPLDAHCQHIWAGSVVTQLFIWIFLHTWF